MSERNRPRGECARLFASAVFLARVSGGGLDCVTGLLRISWP
jgi:hypothetical protein